MKYIGENAIKKLISLIKGDLATKQSTITASGLLKGDGAGTVTAADTQEATLVDVPNGLLKGDGTTISAAVAETDYMVPPTGGITGQVLKKTETGTEWADESCSADAVQSNLDTHVNNTTIHVTAEEKAAWNAKLDSYTETDPTVPAWAKAASKPTYTASEVGLGNVGNFKAVSTVASQGLTDTEKSNARANIGAGTSSLTIGTTASTAAAGNHTHTAANVGAVPTSRTINGKALSANITLAASDVGAATMTEVNTAIQTAIGNAIGGSY